MSEGSAIGLDTIVKQAEELVASDMDGEVVMMSVKNGKYFGLDDVGSAIWPLIEEPCSVSDVCEQLLLKFDVERDLCRKDVLGFLNDLAEKEIVEVVDGADS